MHLQKFIFSLPDTTSSYPAHVKLHMRLTGPVDWLSRVPQDSWSVDWLLAVSLRSPLSPHQPSSRTPMTSSTFLLLVRKPHLRCSEENLILNKYDLCGTCCTWVRGGPPQPPGGAPGPQPPLSPISRLFGLCNGYICIAMFEEIC